MFHYVYDENDIPAKVNGNYISKEDLAEELAFLKLEHFYFPTWKEVRDYVDGKLLLPDKSIVLTFDDGAYSFLDNGIPSVMFTSGITMDTNRESDTEDKIDYDATQARLDRFKVIMDSMTKQEKDEPSLIKGKRIERIARGAGVSAGDVRELLKQYNNSKKMMGSVGKDRKMRKRMQKQMGGMELPDAGGDE
jgi:hypothetical protein